MPLQRVCVFCGSSFGVLPEFSEAAQLLGESLAKAGIGLVYGGGNVGLMGVVADAALRVGGEVIGVIPDFLDQREVGHSGLTQLHVVGSMHERKALMEKMSDGFIALPGGIGTFEELFEILTWAQLGVHQKPVGLLDVAGYYQPLKAMLEQAVTSGFLKQETSDLLLKSDSVTSLIKGMQSFQPGMKAAWSHQVKT